MLSIPLLKQNMKSNTIYASFFCLLIILVHVLPALELEGMMWFPDWGYELLILIIPMIYVTFMAFKLTIWKVRNGIMGYYLTAGYSRKQVIVTQGWFIISSLFAIFAFAFGSEIISEKFILDIDVKVMADLLLNFGIFCVQLFVGGICFALFCIIKRRRTACLSGVIFLITFTVLFLFDIFNPADIAREDTIEILILFSAGMLGLLFFMAGMKLFEKRELSL